MENFAIIKSGAMVLKNPTSIKHYPEFYFVTSDRIIKCTHGDLMDNGEYSCCFPLDGGSVNINKEHIKATLTDSEMESAKFYSRLGSTSIEDRIFYKELQRRMFEKYEDAKKFFENQKT